MPLNNPYGYGPFDPRRQRFSSPYAAAFEGVDPFAPPQVQDQAALESLMSPAPSLGFDQTANPFANLGGQAGEYGYGGGEGSGFGGGGLGEPSVVDTTGQFSGFGLGNAIQTAMPGGSFARAANAFGQSFAGGPYAVSGWDNTARPGSQSWAANMAAREIAQRRNKNWGRAQRANDARASGKRSSQRNTAPGRRGSRDRGQQDRDPQRDSNDIRDSGSF